MYFVWNLHQGECFKHKATSVSRGNKDIKKKPYLVSLKPIHKHKCIDGQEQTSSRIKHCSTFKEGNDEHKRVLIKLVKTKLPICNKSFCWSHETKNCKMDTEYPSY